MFGDCGVCGDKAIGRNFGAISCDSCKAFFRRNVLQNDIPVCRFDGNCIINMKTRKRCTSCRMKKCIQMGMKSSVYNPTNVYEMKDLCEINYSCNKMMDRDVEDLISLTKNLMSFNSLCFNDQLALIKYSSFEIIILRHSIHYEINTDYWTWVWKSDNSSIGGFKLSAFKYEKRGLTAILLFNPNRPNLTHRDVVK
ncbi:unnamed protein product [Medioppia subpectinata]|uniref:Nuclear receptor domain-containing protein n=1 Tax=Medioppia subpectinata TaxID=1979941 RepID=A0A7R9KAU2_9ACAR|nr:unnamed protein product [Medioppia subpectinata]CAG2100006.1 unnamed protein product [Medioppia subpectinata]